MRLIRCLFLIICICFSLNTLATVQNNFTFISDIQDQRFQHLIKELRCLVCQNQSLAESNAPLAQDLKNEVRSKIQSGMTDEEIKQYLVTRYGEYVLFKPPVNHATFILWLGPVIFLVGSFFILFISIKNQKK